MSRKKKLLDKAMPSLERSAVNKEIEDILIKEDNIDSIIRTLHEKFYITRKKN